MPRYLFISAMMVALYTSSLSAAIDDFERMRHQVESLGDLTEAPQFRLAEGYEETRDLKAIYFRGLPFQGKPTEVFAWVGLPPQRQGKVPGVVLVHGGGGTAFKEWVERWNAKGFAAISIAVEGQTDQRAERFWQKHPTGGPSRSGIYGDTDEPIEDQWMYHAVADTVLANSLLRSHPEIDANQVGVMGISWGGVITSTVMGIDRRFAFAIPTYGCGNLATAKNQYGRALGNNQVYQQVWDPMIRLNRATMPALWFSWPGDKHFPLDKQAKCYQTMSGPASVSLVPGLRHGHQPGWKTPDSYMFARSIVDSGQPWCRCRGVSLDATSGKVVARFTSKQQLDGAQLVSTTDSGITGDRSWKTTPITVTQQSGEWVVHTTLPQNTTNWFINVKSNGATISSPYQSTDNKDSSGPDSDDEPEDSGQGTSSISRPTKPNIVLILADDLGWQDVKCYDVDEPSPMETPNLDELAKKGVMFWQAYAPAPTCAPTRCAIMSGNHPARAQKTHVVGGAPPAPHHRRSWAMMSPWYSGRMPEDEITLAKVLQRNGYTTGHCGKWHMAIDHHAYPQPEDQGFDWTKSERGTTRSMKPHRLSDFATDQQDDPYRLDENGFPYHQNSVDALAFLNEHQDKPFFLYYATWLVHTPIHTRSRPLLDKYVKKLGVNLPENPEEWRKPGQSNPFYCAMVEQLDYYVGQLIHHLETTEDPRWPGHMLSENTYLIFTSDNGGMEGSPAQIITDNYPLDLGKISAMEGGTRVPLIVTGPGIPQGIQTSVMANGLDFYPTILSLAGAPKPAKKQLDGCDLSQLLLSNPKDATLVKDRTGKTRDTMVWHFPNSSALESTIRIGDYKLVRNYDVGPHSSNEPLELYQLYDSKSGHPKRVDIEEANNLVTKLPEKAKSMNQRLTEILTEMEASYPYLNPDFRGELPNKKQVCQIVSHVRKQNMAEFTYREQGAKVVRANLIYTQNGGERYEEWFRKPATIVGDSKVIAELPNGTSHYFINLIDENNFLRSFPEVCGKDNKPIKPYSLAALSTGDASPAKQKQPMTGSEEQKISAHFDLNNDGQVTRAEFFEVRENDFKKKDKNGDGVLQPSEHTHPSFATADKNQDKALTQDEFLSIFERHFTKFDSNQDGVVGVDKK